MTPAARYWAVIAAAGGGTRFRSAGPKQYEPLGGRTVLEWSLAPFLDCGWIDGVVVVLPRGDSRFRQSAVAGHPKLLTAVGGGTRAESVLAGLRVAAARCVLPGTAYVLVHDAARPCVERADLERLRGEATCSSGGLLAIPVTDTLKRAGNGQVSGTVDRQGLWRALTPQLYPLAALTNALEQALAAGLEITDEASAMEAIGQRPRLVRGQAANVKVTYPEDLALAEFWLARRDRAPPG